MVAPLAPVQPAVSGVVKVLSTDIVKVEGRFYRRIRKRIPLEKDGKILLSKKGRIRYTSIVTYEPIDVSLHANPIGLGVLGALGALGAALLFGRVRIGGLGYDLELYKGPLADEFDAWKGRRATSSDVKRESRCDELFRRYTTEDLSARERTQIILEAQKLGCDWG